MSPHVPLPSVLPRYCSCRLRNSSARHTVACGTGGNESQGLQPQISHARIRILLHPSGPNSHLRARGTACDIYSVLFRSGGAFANRVKLVVCAWRWSQILQMNSLSLHEDMKAGCPRYQERLPDLESTIISCSFGNAISLLRSRLMETTRLVAVFSPRSY